MKSAVDPRSKRVVRRLVCEDWTEFYKLEDPKHFGEIQRWCSIFFNEMYVAAFVFVVFCCAASFAAALSLAFCILQVVALPRFFFIKILLRPRPGQWLTDYILTTLRCCAASCTVVYAKARCTSVSTRVHDSSLAKYVVASAKTVSLTAENAFSAQEDCRSPAENGSHKADSEEAVSLVQPAVQLPQLSSKRRGQGSRDRMRSKKIRAKNLSLFRNLCQKVDVLPGHTQLSLIEKRQMRAIIRKRVYGQALSISEKRLLCILQTRFDSVQAAEPSAFELAACDGGNHSGAEAVLVDASQDTDDGHDRDALTDASESDTTTAQHLDTDAQNADENVAAHVAENVTEHF